MRSNSIMFLACAALLVSAMEVRADEEAVDVAGAALTASFTAAWNAHDGKAIAAHWAADGDLIDPWGVHPVGRDAVEKFFVAEHTTGMLAKSTYHCDKITVRPITPEVALMDWEVTITGLTAKDGTALGPMVHRVPVVLKKVDGAWKVAAARPGLPNPPAAEPAPAPAP